MVAELSEIYHASLRAISLDKPLPDESGFWAVPPTPHSQCPHYIVYSEDQRPLRPSDFADVKTAGLPVDEKDSSTESTSTDSNSSSSTETLPLLSPYAWVTVLTAASVICILALVIVVFVSGNIYQELTPTPDDGGVFIDPIQFVAKGGSYLPEGGGKVPVDKATTSVSPQVTEGADDDPSVATAESER